MANFAAVHAVVRKKWKQDGAGGRAGASANEYSQERIAISESLRKAESKRRDVVKRYDTNKSGQLEREQLKALMTKVAECDEEVADNDVDYFLKRFDRNKSGGIDSKELEGMLFAFQCYVKSKSKTDKIMAEFDASKDGALHRDEVEKLMVSMNDGKTVSQADVDFVFEEADLLKSGNIEAPEIERAMAIWYVTVSARKRSCCSIQ